MTTITRKKNTGEPGNPGQFGSTSHRESDTSLPTESISTSWDGVDVAIDLVESRQGVCHWHAYDGDYEVEFDTFDSDDPTIAAEASIKQQHLGHLRELLGLLPALDGQLRAEIRRVEATGLRIPLGYSPGDPLHPVSDFYDGEAFYGYEGEDGFCPSFAHSIVIEQDRIAYCWEFDGAELESLVAGEDPPEEEQGEAWERYVGLVTNRWTGQHQDAVADYFQSRYGGAFVDVGSEVSNGMTIRYTLDIDDDSSGEWTLEAAADVAREDVGYLIDNVRSGVVQEDIRQVFDRIDDANRDVETALHADTSPRIHLTDEDMAELDNL